MAGVSCKTRMNGLQQLQARLNQLSAARIDFKPLLEEVGALIESETRYRIETEKESPAGDKWPEWSEAYAKTRHSGHSLLENEGDLADSLTSELIKKNTVETGTPLIYGATQHLGDDDRNIPAREFLPGELIEIHGLEDLLNDFVGRMTS
ncbi:MAG: phage virion morphogenesis protein [Desulfobulbaceae bacterium]|nr:phage virion morphogenesis protein [Desulfobulbaceae bacterium]